MFKAYLSNERGAVTVDWVALTAGIMGLGIMVVYAVMNGSADGLLDGFAVLNASLESTAEIVTSLAQGVNINH